jgi:hypothetical protein
MRDSNETAVSLPEAIVATVERSADASPAVQRVRLWATLDKYGLGADVKKLSAKIKQDIEKERASGRRRQKRTPHNEPPAELRRRFEAVNEVSVTAGTKRAPGEVRYELQGPVEKYRTDFSQDELEVLVRAIENGLAAARQNVTSSYGESLGGGGRRDGGVQDRQRLAYVTHQHNLAHMPRAWWPVFSALVESSITIMDIGRWVLPGIADERVLRGAGRAFVKMLAQSLLDVEIKRRGAERGEKPDRNMVNQMRRERAARIRERT